MSKYEWDETPSGGALVWVVGLVVFACGVGCGWMVWG